MHSFELAVSRTDLGKINHSDAQHIAISTILKVDSLVSWNFRHMVNFFRIRQYNSINLKYGYSTIDIRSPNEVSMKTTIKKADKEFHAVEFMRQVREELTEQFYQDREKYLEDLRKSMEDFKVKQEKAYS